MAKITIKGDTSGEVDIVAPAVAGTTTYNLSTAGGDILATGDIGTTVQGYDADTAKYDDATANFTGTLQVSGNAVATQAYVDSEVGSISVTPTQVSDQANTSTGYFDLPSGTTAQRPASPASGMVRYNTTLGLPEWYDSNSSSWITFDALPPYSADVLIVAGGGGGGYNAGGGGGAGGYIALSSQTVNVGTGYSIVVGGGGSAVTNTSGTSGSSSSAFGSTASGGGGGGLKNVAGLSGGSGGGGGHTTGGAGAGTSGQGNSGGAGGDGAYGQRGGGGGGKGAAGAAGNILSIGGVGSQWLNGTYYAGGGGGGTWNNATVSSGGNGGGGNGGTSGATPTAGSANTGGGGGAGGYGSHQAANGGSGIVIIRYAGSQRGTGGTVTSSGGYTYHTFTSSSSYTG